MQQFKIGDWVDYAGEFYRVHEEYNGKGNISKEVVNSLVRHDKNVQLWQPKEGEWVWYGYELVQVIDRQTSHIKICRQQSDAYEEVQEHKLEPFMGILPSFIKAQQ